MRAVLPRPDGPPLPAVWTLWTTRKGRSVLRWYHGPPDRRNEQFLAASAGKVGHMDLLKKKCITMSKKPTYWTVAAYEGTRLADWGKYGGMRGGPKPWHSDLPPADTLTTEPGKYLSA